MTLTLYGVVIWLATGTLIGMYYMGLFIGALIIRFWNWTQGAYGEYMEDQEE